MTDAIPPPDDEPIDAEGDAALMDEDDASAIIEAYRCQTIRLDSLTRFLDEFCPGIVSVGNDPATDQSHLDDDVVSARNLAIIACFRAVRAIANGSAPALVA